ncbi:ATP-binding cassette domain-containing protein [Desulforhopalus sp. IMCC35007]|nr:ATP-binding cassette domain-containing protein [Desulforhopalus sp. IMCC35007]
MKSIDSCTLKNGQVDAIAACSLMKRYKGSGHQALNDLSLQVTKGEFFGLLGANGAGKTTAVSLFSGFMSPDSGTVSIMGMGFRRDAKKIRQILGLVPQEIALYDQLTARENLLFFGRLYGFRGKKLQERIDQCLEFSRLTEQASRLVFSYSGGMKRRLNLATGLLHLPEILFLDEPTVGVDTQSRHLIHQQLVELNQKGTTILYTTHYMEEAQELCSRIGILDAGSIIKQGSPDELLKQSDCRNLEDLFLQLTGKQLRDT